MTLFRETQSNSFQKKLKAELLRNCLNTHWGPLLVAGQNQFKTLWVRDFCFSVEGLLLSERADVVENSLRLILSYKNKNHLLPRGLDILNPKKRVLLNTGLKSFLPWFEKSLSWPVQKLNPSPRKSLIPSLQAEYKGEHGTIAIDSNLLWLISALKYLNYLKIHSHSYNKNSDILSSSKQWREKIFSNFESLLSFYDTFFKQGLLHQPAFSDWQDSARREGPTLYVNVLYFLTLHLLKNEFGADPEFISKIKTIESRQRDHFSEKFLNLFFDPQKYLFFEASSVDNIKRLSLEAHFLILEHQLFSKVIDHSQLYWALKDSPAWPSVGVPVWPKYSPKEISWTTRLVGLKHYHDGLEWSWLWGSALKIAQKYNDIQEAEKIRVLIESCYERDQTIFEVYTSDRGLYKKPIPFQSRFYKSESPFSWGLAQIISGLNN